MLQAFPNLYCSIKNGPPAKAFCIFCKEQNPFFILPEIITNAQWYLPKPKLTIVFDCRILKIPKILKLGLGLRIFYPSDDFGEFDN